MAVRGMGTDDASAGPGELVARVGRLGEDFHYTLVILPPDHRSLTVGLLTIATRVLLVAALDEMAQLRATLANLPMPADDYPHPELAVILTDTSDHLNLTLAMTDILDRELGVSVRGLIPATVAKQPPAIATVARWLVGQRIGWVLGAGGARGFAHIGALAALRRARLPVDCATGSSVGAIISAGVSGMMPLSYIEAALTGGALRVFRPTFPLHGVLSSRALANWFQRGDVYGHVLIEQMPRPFAVSAADLREGREIVIRRGLLWKATLASAAIPGIYPPVQIGPHMLVDGGVVNPVPISVARLLGADIVVAVDLTVPIGPHGEVGESGLVPARVPTLVDSILRSRDIIMSEIRSHTVDDSAILIIPKVTRVAMRKFVEGKQYMNTGEEAVEEVLPRLREVLPWLNEPTDGEPVYTEELDPYIFARN